MFLFSKKEKIGTMEATLTVTRDKKPKRKPAVFVQQQQQVNGKGKPRTTDAIPIQTVNYYDNVKINLERKKRPVSVSSYLVTKKYRKKNRKKSKQKNRNFRTMGSICCNKNEDS